MMMPEVPSLSRNVRPLRSTSNTATMVITQLRILIAVPLLDAASASMPACCRMVVMNCRIELIPVACVQPRMTQANTNGMTYLRAVKISPIEVMKPVCGLECSCARESAISCISKSASAGVRDFNSAARAASGLPRRNNHRGDSLTRKLPIKNTNPGYTTVRNMPRQAWSATCRTASWLLPAASVAASALPMK